MIEYFAMGLRAMAKIIFVNRYFYPDLSATSQLLTDLTIHMARTHNVHVVTSRQRYDDPDARLPRTDEVEGIHVWRVWSSRFGRGFLPARTVDYVTFYLAALVKLLVLTRSGDVIVAKTDPPLISVVAAMVARLRGAKLINWLQDVFPEVAQAVKMPGAHIVSSLLLPIRNWSLRSARLNVAIGDRMGRILSSLPLGSSTRVAVIHNWADGRAIVPVAHKDNPLRKDWEIGDHFVVGYSGNMGRVHELGAILDAADSLKTDRRFLFLFIGAGAGWNNLVDESRNRKLGNVLFRPHQPRERLTFSLGVSDVHIVSLKASLEGYVVPSKFYGIAAAGRPVANIGDTGGEIAGIIAQACCGETFVPGDTSGIVGYLQRLAGDPETCARLGKQARENFDRHFSTNQALDRWQAVINSVLSNNDCEIAVCAGSGANRAGDARSSDRDVNRT